ncbi:MAG: hypothetical protein AAF487_04195 [Bacteroidota bacterium]
MSEVKIGNSRALILLIGICSSLISLCLVNWISANIQFNYEGHMGIGLLNSIRGLNEVQTSKWFYLLTVSLILNGSLALNIFIRTGKSITPRALILSTLVLAMLILLIIGLLAELSWFLALLAPIFAFALPVVLVMLYGWFLAYYLKVNITTALGSSLVFLILSGLVMYLLESINENLTYYFYDTIWFFCLTGIVPFFLERNSKKESISPLE